MGDPRKIKKRYSRPIKMWDANRLAAEKPVVEEFGLKNKKELWKLSSIMKKYASQAKRLIASRTQQSEVERKQVIAKLAALGIVNAQASIDDVLGLTLDDFFRRRLQTLVLKKNLARSIRQARQFIVHRHIRVGSRVVTSPSYLVPVADEPSVGFVERSALADAGHPERAAKVKETPEVPEEDAKKG